MTTSSSRPAQPEDSFLFDTLASTSATTQSKRRTRAGSSARVVAGITAAGALLLGLLIHQAGKRPEAQVRVHPIGPSDIALVDLGDVAVTVEVTNLGTEAVTPLCQVQALDATGTHTGAGAFTLRAPLEPGQTTISTVKVRISGQGAASVTQANSTCG